MSAETGVARPLHGFWRDIAWQASGNSLAQLVGIAGIPVLTRLYTPADFAIQSLFLQVVTYATALVTWRYEYFIQLPKAEGDARALNRLVFGIGCATVLASTPVFWVFQDAIATKLGNPDVGPWLVLAPLTALLFSWAITAQNNTQRRGDFKVSGMSELAGKLSYVATGVIGAFAHPGAAGLVVTSAASAIGKSVFLLFKQPQRRDTQQVDRFGLVRVGRHYGRLATSTVLAHLLSTSALAVPLIAIAHLYGPEVLGQFALVVATIFLPSALLGAAVGHVYYQRAAKLWAEGLSFLHLWREMAQKLVLVGVPVYAAVALLAELAYPFVFGDQWHVAGEFATWMAAAAFASFVSSPMDRTCLVVGAASYLLLWSGLRLALTLAAIWLAVAMDLPSQGFVMAFATQMCVAMGVDLWMSRRFAQGRVGVFS